MLHKHNSRYINKALAIIIASFTCISCTEEDPTPYTGESSCVIIYNNGKTSTGAKYSQLNNQLFYIDNIIYEIVGSHLEIKGCTAVYEETQLRPYEQVTKDGITYETLLIQDCAFSNCQTITEVILPESLQYIGCNAFERCLNLKNIIFPEGLTNILACAFLGCEKLENAILPNNLCDIGNCAFYGCKNLKSAYLPEGINSIGNYTFYDCESLTYLTMPDNLISIGNYAFSGCDNIVKIKLPESLKIIGNYAFSNCENLRNIQLGRYVENIGERAFYFCPNIREIVCKSEIPPIVKNSWEDSVCNSVNLFVPGNSIGKYRSAEFWAKFKYVYCDI